mgnify:CR=1 FL=1
MNGENLILKNVLRRFLRRHYLKCCSNTEDTKTRPPRETSAVVFMGLQLVVQERNKAEISAKALDFLVLAGAKTMLSLGIGWVTKYIY